MGHREVSKLRQWAHRNLPEVWQIGLQQGQVEKVAGARESK